MKSSSKLALLTGLLAASTQSLGANVFEYGNPYDDIPQLSYSGSKPVRKSNLTNKQKKARAKAKASKQARRKNR